MKNTGKLRSFHTIAVPHKDVLDGNLTMEVFAADLWEVHMGRAPADYRDSEAFFNRTYLTQGLRDLIRRCRETNSWKWGRPSNSASNTLWRRKNPRLNCTIS